MALKFYKGMTVAQAKAGLNKDGVPVETGSILFPLPVEGESIHIYLKNGSNAGDILEYGGGDGGSETLDKELTTMIQVGNLKANTKLEEGTSVLDIIKQMIYAVYHPYIYSEASVSAAISNKVGNSGGDWDGSYVIANGKASAAVVSTVTPALTKTVIKCKKSSGENTYAQGIAKYSYGTSKPTDDKNYTTTTTKTYTGSSQTINNVAEYTLVKPSIPDTKVFVKIDAGSEFILNSESKTPTYFGDSSQAEVTNVGDLKKISTDGSKYFLSSGSSYVVNSAEVSADIPKPSDIKVYGYHPIYVPSYMGSVKTNSNTTTNPINNAAPTNDKFNTPGAYWEIELIETANNEYVIPTGKMNAVSPELAYHVEKSSGNGDIYVMVNCPEYIGGNKFQVLCPTSCKPSKLYQADFAGNWADDGHEYINFTKKTNSYKINGVSYNIWEFALGSADNRAALRTVIVFTHNNN